MRFEFEESSVYVLCVGDCRLCNMHSVYVAQLDRASAYEAGDCGFESRRGLYFFVFSCNIDSYLATDVMS